MPLQVRAVWCAVNKFFEFMIDLHGHILPGIDDGAADLSMPRAWAADGVTTVACTPHICPGLYHSTGSQIQQAVQEAHSVTRRHSLCAIRRLAQSGVWMQRTAVSLTGAFGRTTRYPADRMIDEGCVHILATDTRTTCGRSANLGEGREFAARRRGGASCLHSAPRLTR